MAAVIENAQLQDYYRSAAASNGISIMKVAKHKASSKYGTVNLVIVADVERLIKIYLRHCRPNITSCPLLFTNRTGKPVRCAQEMSRHWAAVTGNHRAVNKTCFRKAVATYIDK